MTLKKTPLINSVFKLIFEIKVLILFLLGLESNNLAEYYSHEIKISIVEVAKRHILQTLSKVKLMF